MTGFAVRSHHARSRRIGVSPPRAVVPNRLWTRLGFVAVAAGLVALGVSVALPAEGGSIDSAAANRPPAAAPVAAPAPPPAYR